MRAPPPPPLPSLCRSYLVLLNVYMYNSNYIDQCVRLWGPPHASWLVFISTRGSLAPVCMFCHLPHSRNAGLVLLTRSTMPDVTTHRAAARCNLLPVRGRVRVREHARHRNERNEEVWGGGRFFFNCAVPVAERKHVGGGGSTCIAPPES